MSANEDFIRRIVEAVEDASDVRSVDADALAHGSPEWLQAKISKAADGDEVMALLREHAPEYDGRNQY